MGDLKKLITSYNDIVLPTAWDIEDKSPLIDIDSSGLKVSYTDPDDFKAVIVRANNPIPSECGIFYFEIKILNKGKNGMIGIGYCTKQTDKEINNSDYINNMLMPGQEYKENNQAKESELIKENETWGCGYHGDDGCSFYSGSGGPYGESYTTGDIIGCYLNFRNKIVFYTKNGINLGIACHLPNDLEGNLYPYVGFRSQGGSVEVNFGNERFKYSAMTNEDINERQWHPLATLLKGFKGFQKKTKKKDKDISKIPLILEYQENVYFIMGGYEKMLVNLTDELTESLEKDQSNVFELSYRGKIYYIMGKYDKAFGDLTRLLEIEPDNTMALKYRGEINYMLKRYNESVADLEKLLRIKPNDVWAKKAYKLVKVL